ncbi:MAG: MarR family transcriptional regulator [Anaerolineaceae bacterium]|nr:MarR family transcriptional regulator [Anaerolineaceae bacterium]
MDPIFSFNRLIDLLIRAFSEMDSETTRQSELSDLSMKQIIYLEMITRLEKPTFSDLAVRFNVTKPSVTAIIAKLIQKGYVRKIQSNDDRRNFYIVLTEKGQMVNEKHQNLHRRIAERLSQKLSLTELNQLQELLNKIVS